VLRRRLANSLTHQFVLAEVQPLEELSVKSFIDPPLSLVPLLITLGVVQFEHAREETVWRLKSRSTALSRLKPS